jgi:hypothetical protein
MKKGQITVYVIIGVVLVLIVALFFMFNKNTNVLEYEAGYMDLASEKSSIKYYTKECLKESALDAMNLFGTKDSYSLTHYVEKSIVTCVDKFNNYNENGFDVELTDPKVKVMNSNELISFSLNYPVNFKKNENEYTLEDIEFNIPLYVSAEVIDGEIASGTQIVSTDRRAIISFDETTQVEIDSGEQIDQIQIGLVDKKINGLTNNLIIDNLIYEGKPEGVVFNPPPKISFVIDESKLSVDPDLIKISYFDEVSGIWHTYANNFYDDEQNILSADLEHFSLIGVNICGEEEGSYLIHHSFEDPYGMQATPAIWNYNFERSGDSLKIDIEGAHLLPDFVEQWSCNQEIMETIESINAGIIDELSYSEFYTIPAFVPEHCTISSDNELFQDWDQDDEYGREEYEEYEYKLELWYGTSLILGDYKEYSGDELSEGIKKKCQSACEIESREVLASMYGWLDDSFISGDGINDFSEIKCRAMVDRVDDFDPTDKVIKCMSLDTFSKDSIDAKDTLYSDSNVKTYETFDIKMEEIVGNSKTKRTRFLATPITPGYKELNLPSGSKLFELPSGSKILEQIEYGSISHKSFFIPDKGGTCVQDLDSVEAFLLQNSDSNNNDKEIPFALELWEISLNDFEASIKLPEDKDVLENLNYYIYSEFSLYMRNLFLGFPSLKSDYDESCSDECVWKLNDDKLLVLGKLRAGENIISLRIDNLKDPVLYGKGTVKITGKGIISDGTDCPEYFNSPEIECSYNNPSLVRDCYEPKSACCPTKDYCVSEQDECRPSGFSHSIDLGGYLCDHSIWHECTEENYNNEVIINDQKYYCNGQNEWIHITKDVCDDVAENMPTDCSENRDTVLVKDCWNEVSGCCPDVSYCVDKFGCYPTGYYGIPSEGGYSTALCINGILNWCEVEGSIVEFANKVYTCKSNGEWNVALDSDECHSVEDIDCGNNVMIKNCNGIGGCCSDATYCFDDTGCHPSGYYYYDSSSVPRGYLCDDSAWEQCNYGEEKITNIDGQIYDCSNGHWDITRY